MSNQPKVSVYGTHMYMLTNVDAGDHNVTADMFDVIFRPEWFDHARGTWNKAIAVRVDPAVYMNMHWRDPNVHRGDPLIVTILEASMLKYALTKHVVTFSEYTIGEDGSVILCSAQFESEALHLAFHENSERYQMMVNASGIIEEFVNETKEEVSNAQ